MNILGDIFRAILIFAMWVVLFSACVIVFVTLAAYAFQSLVWALLALSAVLQ